MSMTMVMAMDNRPSIGFPLNRDDQFCVRLFLVQMGHEIRVAGHKPGGFSFRIPLIGAGGKFVLDRLSIVHGVNADLSRFDRDLLCRRTIQNVNRDRASRLIVHDLGVVLVIPQLDQRTTMRTF